ncbi:MAG: hypothetical protein OHK0046_46360 [Anaerolineae bacterium]
MKRQQIQPAGAVPLYLKTLLYGERHAGKTYTGLGLSSLFATWLGSRLLVIDADPIANVGGAASAVVYYGSKWQFDYLPLGEDTHPRRFIEAIQVGVEAGYQVIMIDGLEQAWIGGAGLLSAVEQHARQRLQGNTFAAWKMGSEEQDHLIRAIELARVHIFATCVARPKSEQKGGEVSSKGVLPLQRPGFEYQWMLACRMHKDHSLRITASKLGDDFAVGLAYPTPGRKFAAQLLKRVTHSPASVDEIAAATVQVVVRASAEPTAPAEPAADTDLPGLYAIEPAWTYVIQVDVVANRTNQGHRYILSTPLGKLNLFTAARLREAGWIDDDDWREVGTYTPLPQIPVRVQKLQGKHLELLEVDTTPNGSESEADS